MEQQHLTQTTETVRESVTPSITRAAIRVSKAEWTPWMLMGGALVVFALLFVIPVLNLFLVSLSPSKSLQIVFDNLGPANYSKIVTDSFYLEVLWRTIKLASITVLTTLLIGYPLAYHMVRSTGRKRAYLTLLVVSPLLVNVLVRTLGWIVMLGNNGVVNWILLGSGMFREPMKLLFTETAIIIGLTHVLLPFMVLSLAAALQNIDPSLLLASQSLGANKVQTFLRITLPLSLPGIAAGSLLVFALSSSSFATPILLGGAFNKVMSYLVYEQAIFRLNWAVAATIAFTLMFSVATLVFLYLKAVQSERFGRVFG